MDKFGVPLGHASLSLSLSLSLSHTGCRPRLAGQQDHGEQAMQAIPGPQMQSSPIQALLYSSCFKYKLIYMSVTRTRSEPPSCTHFCTSPSAPAPRHHHPLAPALRYGLKSAYVQPHVCVDAVSYWLQCSLTLVGSCTSVQPHAS